jgi:DNA-binding MarR family transcriptional regulator
MRASGRLDTARLSEADRTWRLLVELVMETRGEWRRKVVEATGLPFSRVRALWRLEHGPRTLAELAQQMGADAPATTVLVDALEQRGLVKRMPHPTDRRAKQVSITAAGRRIVDVVEKIGDPPPAAFERLPDVDLRRLRATLEKTS